MSDSDPLWSEKGDPNKEYRVQKYGLTYGQWEAEANALADSPLDLYYLDVYGMEYNDPDYGLCYCKWCNARGYIPARITENGKRVVLSAYFWDRVLYTRDKNDDIVILSYRMIPKIDNPVVDSEIISELPDREKYGCNYHRYLKEKEKTLSDFEKSKL